jgi:toxin-antitoxin system PIN domain toxin
VPSSTDLLDANVWLALAVEAHTHHSRAKRYWEQEAAASVGFCRITHVAFLRHLTNKSIMGALRLAPAAAFNKAAEFLALPEVRMVPEPAGLDDVLEGFCRSGQIFPNWWTDAYLAAFARAADLRLVSFDQGLSKLPGIALLNLRV